MPDPPTHLKNWTLFVSYIEIDPIGKSLLVVWWLLQKPVVAAARTMYQNQFLTTIRAG